MPSRRMRRAFLSFNEMIQRRFQVFILLGVLTSVFFFAGRGIAFSQNRISGRVVDADTGEPLPSANVFFAGTTLGGATNVDGWFSITGFGSGKYDFTVRFVGYVMYQQSYTFTGKDQVRLLIKLSQDAEQLAAIIVRPKDRDRAVNYTMFKKLFLGESKQAKQCEILNPDDLYLYRDQENAMLVAHCATPIIIENRAMGYRIQYYLALFQYHYFGGRLDVYGVPQFEEMKGADDKKKKTWEQNRANGYTGSVIHFMRSMIQNKLVEERFAVSRILKVPDKERPTNEFLTRKIDSLEALEKKGSTYQTRNELLNYRLRRASPLTLDSLVEEHLHGHELMNQDTLTQVNYKGSLVVIFGGSVERTKEGRLRVKDGLHSRLFIHSKFNVYENGYYDNLGNLIFEGYWSASEKLPLMLPLEYQTKPPLDTARQ